MGRYKDYREPRRRGYDDDHSNDRAVENRSRYPNPKAPQASEPVEALVKWFNAEKGFGFIVMPDGSEAFLHIRQVEAAGHSSVPEGARLKVRIGPGQKGLQVTELTEVDTVTSQAANTTEPHSIASTISPRQPVAGATEGGAGTVKWYNSVKGFGFIGQDGGDKDVFVHARTLERSGVTGLAEGQRVRMQIAQGQKGPEARSIELLD